MATPVQKHAQRLLKMEKLARATATQPQLAHSSIEDGAIQDVEQGVLKGIIGRQFDGTHAVAVVNGPKPPTPLSPSAEDGIGTFKIVVADGFVDDALVPMDFARYEIHIIDVDDPNFEPDLTTTLRATVESPRGGEVTFAAPVGVQHWARIVARSTSGVASDPSLAVSATARHVGLLDLDPEIDLGGGPSGPPAASPSLEIAAYSKSFTAYAIGEVDQWTTLRYEVATDAAFTNIVQTVETRQTVVSLGPFDPVTDYYIRVTAFNNLGGAAPSAVVGPVQTITYGVSDIPDLADAVENANQALLDAAAAQGVADQALSDAETKAAAAEAAAIAAAALDAQSKADAAEAAATAAAATDAQSKADAAQAAAEAAAQTYADTVASGAEADAIAAAAADAQSKADAAQAAAESAAAADATAKANAAQAAATAAAATDAQAKADAALAAAIAATDDKVRWATAAPTNGVTEGRVGDLIYVKAGDGSIAAIWEATGTDTWTQRYVASAAIKDLAVGKITGLQDTLAELPGGGHLIDPVPVLANNSPSDGLISWPAFTIRYRNHTLNVPAGNTQERWTVYRWDAGTGTGSIEFTPDKPTLATGDMILFVNNAGIPLRPFATVLVDGDLLVDGSVVTSALASEAVTAEKIAGKTITGDLLSGDLVTGTTISTGLQTEDGLRMGARVEMGPAGLTIFDSAEQVIFQFPLNALDRAKVRAHMDMISADVEGNFRLHGTNNSIVTGGELVLDQGITAPVTPPDVEAVWDQVQFDTTTAVPPHNPSTNFNLGTFALNPSQITSIDWDSIWSVWLVGQQRSNGFRIWRFNANGTMAINTTTGKPWVDDFNSWSDASVVFDGDAASLFGKFGGTWYIMGRTQSGTRLINTIPSAWITDFQGRPPTPSYDSGANQYFIAQSDGGGAGRLTIRRFWLNPGSDYPNAQTGTLLQMEAGSGLASRLHGCVYTSGAGLGGSRYVVSADAYQSVWPHSTAGAVMDDDGSYEVWLKPGLARAFGFNGTQFVSVDATGKLTLYENWTWTTSNSDAYVGISAFDSDTAGVSTGVAAPHAGQTAGQHETPISEPLKFQQLRRAKLKFTVQETNDSGGADDPDKWKIYMIRKSTTPVAADFKHVVTLGSPSAISTHTISADPTGVAPPGGIVGTVGALNNFPGGGFGSIESAAFDLDGPIIKAQGNGPGRMGPWAWDADGKVTKHPIFGYEGTTPTPTALNQTQNLTVNFPAGMFDVPPAVTVTHNAVNPYTCDVSVTSITTSSCIVRGSRRAGGLAGVPFTLIAVPMG